MIALTGWVDAASSWSDLLPTFILESVDLRLDKGAIRAYSCAGGTGGGRKGEPGDGKGDEDESLLTVTVSEGVSGRECRALRAKAGNADSFWAYLLSRD
jgi:hypothetical protein